MNNTTKNRLYDKLFKYTGIALTTLALVVLAIFIIDIAKDGIARIDWKFLTSAPSTLSYKRAGIYPALGGTLWVFVLTAFFAIPLGVAAGVYLEEYTTKNRYTNFLRIKLIQPGWSSFCDLWFIRFSVI